MHACINARIYVHAWLCPHTRKHARGQQRRFGFAVDTLTKLEQKAAKSEAFGGGVGQTSLLPFPQALAPLELVERELGDDPRLALPLSSAGRAKLAGFAFDDGDHPVPSPISAQRIKMFLATKEKELYQ